MNFGLNINNRAGSVDYERFGLKQEKVCHLKEVVTILCILFLLITMVIV